MISSAQAQDIQMVLKELTSNLKPEAFKGSWNKDKDAWMDKLGDMDIAKLGEAQDELLGLMNHIKPKAFNKGVYKDLLGQLSSPKNAAQIANIMDTMVKGIKPSMFKEGFDPGMLTKEIEKYM